MKILNHKFLLAMLVILLPRITHSAPVIANLNDFSGTESILTFNELVEGQLVSDEYLSEGVDFSNNVIVTASTSSSSPIDAWQFFNSPGNAVLQNFNSSQNTTTFTIDFIQSRTLIGLDVITSTPDAEFHITSASSGDVTTFLLSTGTPDLFFAFYDQNGISKLVIETNGNFLFTDAVGINDLRFENISAVPVPGSLGLFIVGLFTLLKFKNNKKA